MAINPKVFFDAVRHTLFSDTLSQGQVNGMNAILDGWEVNAEFTDIRWLAYMLATTKWETAHTMQPIEEYGHGHGHSYGEPDPVTGKTYYGRGFVQLTWKSNYQKLARVTGIDLVNFPEYALQLPVATQILFDGMRDGLFTGVGLGRYFNEATDDPYNARKIINGLDKADTIKTIHGFFLEALKAATVAA